MALNLQQQIRDRNDRMRERGFHLDFSRKGNIEQPFEMIVDRFATLAAHKWGVFAQDGGFHNDAQIATASVCALTTMLEGFYLKRPRLTRWANGELVTLTDRGVHPGDDYLEYETGGFQWEDDDDGIVAPDQTPESSVEVATDLTRQRMHTVIDKVQITWQEIQRANKKGYDAFARKGEGLRRKHSINLNNLIRRGNKKHKVTGVTTHPGIRRRIATVDWGSADADVIYDDYMAALRQVFTSETEEEMPRQAVLPLIQWHHIMSEQNSVNATDTTLMSYIEANTPNHEIISDPGMRYADSLGGPAALFYTNEPELLSVSMPYFMRVLPPHDKDVFIIEIYMMSRYAGVQVKDVDTLLLVEGSPAGWQQFV